MPLELAVTQGVKEGKSKLEVSHLYSRKQLTGFCRDEGLGMDRSIEHLASTEEPAQGEREKGVNKERDLEKEGGFCQRRVRCFKDSTSGRALKKLINMGLVPPRIWWDEAFGICPTQRIGTTGKKKRASFDIFL